MHQLVCGAPRGPGRRQENESGVQDWRNRLRIGRLRALSGYRRGWPPTRPVTVGKRRPGSFQMSPLGTQNLTNAGNHLTRLVPRQRYVPQSIQQMEVSVWRQLRHTPTLLGRGL